MKRFQIRSLFWSIFSYIRTQLRKIRTRKNSVFGHFSHSVTHWKTWWFGLLLTCLSDLFYSKVAFYGRYSNIGSILRNNKTLHLRCLWGHWPHFCNFWAATLLHHFFFSLLIWKKNHCEMLWFLYENTVKTVTFQEKIIITILRPPREITCNRRQ